MLKEINRIVDTFEIEATKEVTETIRKRGIHAVPNMNPEAINWINAVAGDSVLRRFGELLGRLDEGSRDSVMKPILEDDLIAVLNNRIALIREASLAGCGRIDFAE